MQIEKANPCFRERHVESNRRSGGGRAPQRRLTLLPGRGLPVTAVLADNGLELCGTNSHPYEVYLALNDIEHRRTRVRQPQTNSFVERFHRTVLDEFFRSAFRTTFYETVEALQADLDAWLVHYNTERPHHSYGNMGKRPSETILSYLESVRREA